MTDSVQKLVTILRELPARLEPGDIEAELAQRLDVSPDILRIFKVDMAVELGAMVQFTREFVEQVLDISEFPPGLSRDDVITVLHFLALWQWFSGYMAACSDVE